MGKTIWKFTRFTETLFSELAVKVGFISWPLEGTVTLQVVLFGKNSALEGILSFSEDFAGIQKSIINMKSLRVAVETDITLCMSSSGGYLFCLQENPSFRRF